MHTNSPCIFCRIASGNESARIVWEDAKHLAILTPYPNTPGVTVVITRQHQTSDVLSLNDSDFQALLLASKSVSAFLKQRLGVHRVGLVIEGMGVDHAHTKLFPLHGVKDEWKPVLSNVKTFTESYLGYLSSHDGPRMSDDDLDAILDKLKCD